VFTPEHASYVSAAFPDRLQPNLVTR